MPVIGYVSLKVNIKAAFGPCKKRERRKDRNSKMCGTWFLFSSKGTSFLTVKHLYNTLYVLTFRDTKEISGYFVLA
jgi:hypothetical protein